MFILDKIGHEFSQFTPKFDDSIRNLYVHIIVSKNRELFKAEKDKIIGELHKSSEQNILYLSSFINSNEYLSSLQLQDIMKSHFQFLINEFFSIIKMNADVHFELHDEQIKKDKLELEKICAKFKENINKKIPLYGMMLEKML